MTDTKQPQPPSSDTSAGEPGRSGAKPTTSAFDVWLNRGLHQLFDDVANEPVPEELLRLIQEDRSK